MIFYGNSLHCKGPILEAKFWAERMVVLRSSASPAPGQKLKKCSIYIQKERRNANPHLDLEKKHPNQ